MSVGEAMTTRREVHIPEGDALRWNGLFRMGAIAALIVVGLGRSSSADACTSLGPQ